MIKLLFLMAFLLMGSYPLKAAQALESEQDFLTELDNIKNPFEDGLPKPVAPPAPPPQVYQPVVVAPPVVKPKPKPVVVIPVKLPDLKLEGVMVGDDMHEAIIDGKIVSLHGVIKGVRVISVSKQGVGLLFKRKKFFLKID